MSEKSATSTKTTHAVTIMYICVHVAVVIAVVIVTTVAVHHRITKINHFQIKAVIDHAILQFEIVVTNSFLIRIVERRCHLSEKAMRNNLVKNSILLQVTKYVTSFSVSGKNINIIGIFFHVFDVVDVGMVSEKL